MNNKYVLGLLGLVVGFIVAFSLSGGSASLGIVPSTKTLDSQDLTNELTAISNPLLGWVATSTVMSNVTVGSTTVASSSFTLTGAAVGDYLEWSESTTTTNAILGCNVTAANTVNCYKQTAVPGSAGVAAVTSTVYVLDLPRTTFVSPTGL
jgi:hypothetical protein